MPLFTESTAFRIIDSVAIVLAQAYQLARARVAACASPVLRLMAHRDQVSWEMDLFRRELDILRGQRENLAPHRRPEYSPNQRLAILQVMRLRDWTPVQGAKRFILHPNTVTVCSKPSARLDAASGLIRLSQRCVALSCSTAWS